MKDLSVGMLNELYGNMLTDRQREFVRCYYDYDLSLGEIAEQYGMTRQAVADALRKGEHTLRGCEEKLGFSARLAAVKKDVDAVRTAMAGGDTAAAAALIDGLLKNL